MSKKLKIKFVKFEKALAMQILEQEGNFRYSKHVLTGQPELCCDSIFLCDEEERGDSVISVRFFKANAERDEYLKKVIRWISDEQFDEGEGELKVGKMCEVRDCDYNEWERRKLIAILPEKIKDRYVVEDPRCDNDWLCFRQACPIGGAIEPTIDGDVYTWEM